MALGGIGSRAAPFAAAAEGVAGRVARFPDAAGSSSASPRIVQIPLEITFLGMSPSPAVEVVIRRWISRLEDDYGRLHRCAVLIDQPHQHHERRRRFHVKVDLTVPGYEIAVSRDPERDVAHRDVYVALADAFRAARRQLHDHARIQRGDVKRHRL